MKEILCSKREIDAGVLSPLFVGSAQCVSDHGFGPFIRPYYLIHFCLSGKGSFQNERGVQSVSAGQMFVIRPGEVTTYRADSREPWHYCWIAFEGERAKVMNGGADVFVTPARLGERLQRLFEIGESAPEAYLSILYELIYLLFLQEKAVDHVRAIRQICRYIRYHYMEDLRVSQLSQLFGYERSYFYRLFKREMGKGVKEYITAVRMDRARELLGQGYAVSDAAHLVGYTDEFNFSRCFKVHFGISPKDCKKA